MVVNQEHEVSQEPSEKGVFQRQARIPYSHSGRTRIETCQLNSIFEVIGLRGGGLREIRDENT